MAADMERVETILMENEEKLEKTLNVFKDDLVAAEKERVALHQIQKIQRADAAVLRKIGGVEH